MARGRQAPRRRTKPRRKIQRRRGGVKIRATTRVAPTSGSIALNVFRRLILGPSTIDVTTGQPTAMWLANAVPLLVTAMKVVAQIIKTNVPTIYNGRAVRASEWIQLGGATVLAFGVEDLLLNSPLVFRRNPTPATPISAINTCPYREGLIEWVKVIVTPAAAVSDRKGQFAVALTPISNESEAKNLYINKGGDYDFDCILAMPGGRVYPADRPFAVTYVPRSQDIQSMWATIGSNGVGDPKPWNLGSWPQLKLHLHYYDLASTQANLESQYSDSRATFDLSFSARIRLRNVNDTDESVLSPAGVDAIMRTEFIKLVNIGSVAVRTASGKCEVDSSRLFIQDGRSFILDDEFEILDHPSPMAT